MKDLTLKTETLTAKGLPSEVQKASLDEEAVEEVPEYIRLLFKDRKMKKFKKIFKGLDERAFISPVASPKGESDAAITEKANGVD